VIKKHPFIFRIIFAICLALLAFFIPNVVLRVIFAVISSIFFIIPLKKHGIFFIIVICITSLTVISMNGIISYVNYFTFPIMAREPFGFIGYFFPIPGVSNSLGNISSGYSENLALLPDKEIYTGKKLSITGSFVRIETDPSSNKIKYPSEAKIMEKDGNISISAYDNALPYKIVIGTKNSLEELFIGTEKTDFNGDIKVKNLSINSDEIYFKGNVEADEHANFSSHLTFSFNGGINSENIDFLSELISLNSEIENCKNMTIRSSVFSGKVKYTDSWEDTRYINFLSSGLVQIDVFVPYDSGNVEIENMSGLLNSHKYNY